MDSGRIERIAIWTFSLAFVGVFLGLGKGSAPSLSKLLAVTEGAIGGSLIGFGFGITFAKPRTQIDRWMKVAYATLPFGVIGSLVGKAFGIEDALGGNPGLRPTIVGALWGVAVGAVVGLVVCLTSHVPSDRPGGTDSKDAKH